MKKRILWLLFLIIFGVTILSFVCCAKTCKIEFDTDGASRIPEIVIVAGEDFALPENPSKKNYSFAGWYLDSKYQTKYLPSQKINSDTILYAKWDSLFEYDKKTDGTLAISKYNGRETVLSIPGDIYKMKVTEIKESTFLGKDFLTEVVVPPSVTKIGKGAFGSCVSLSKITLPFIGAEISSSQNKHFGYIFGANAYGENMFYVPNSLKTVMSFFVEEIGDYAFWGCTGIERIHLAMWLGNIGDYAFFNCHSLKTITLPSTLRTIGDSAFYGCSSLTDYSGEKYDLLTKIGDSAFYDCKSLEEAYIPKNVTYLGKNVFKGADALQSIIFASKDGWFVTDDANATVGTVVSVDNPMDNVSKFLITYSDCYWKKN